MWDSNTIEICHFSSNVHMLTFVTSWYLNTIATYGCHYKREKRDNWNTTKSTFWKAFMLDMQIMPHMHIVPHVHICASGPHCASGTNCTY